ncbi:hypothetical protein ACKLKM_25185, partial [Klebsiella pneumoniae]
NYDVLLSYSQRTSTMRSARLLSSVIPLLLVACTTTKSTELGKPTASSEKSVDLLGDLRAGPNAPEAKNLTPKP